MAQKTFVVTGVLTDQRTVKLDQALPLNSTRVRLAVEPIASVARRPYREVIAEIRARQRARGYLPPTREHVDAYLRAERNSWGE
jgi:hypothetical protein